MIMQRLPPFQPTVSSSVNRTEDDEGKIEQERPLAVLMNDGINNSNNINIPSVDVASSLSQQHQECTDMNYGIFPLMPISSPSSSPQERPPTRTMVLQPGRISPPSYNTNNGHINSNTGSASPLPIRRDGMLQVVEEIPIYSNRQLLEREP